MSAVGMLYANEIKKVDRQTDWRQGCSRLILLRYVWFDSILREELIFDPGGKKWRCLVTAGHQATCLCPTPLNPVRIRRAGERHKSNAQQRRDRETERVTNQTRSVAGQEGQSALQIKAAPSAGWRVKQITLTPSHLPLVRVEKKKKNRCAVAADIKNTEWEREGMTGRHDCSMTVGTNREGENGKWWALC